MFNLIQKKFYRTSSKAHLILTPELEEILVGTLLGDATAEKRNANSNTRIHFKQSTIHKAYVDHLYFYFKDYCNSKPLVLSSFDNRANKMKEYSSIKFQTLSLPCFNKYREIFYNTEGVKIIPSNLEEILTARGLAYWIQDDGYKFNKGFYIATESFTLEEHNMLKIIFNNKFDLECNYHKTTNGYRLYIFSSSMNKLLHLIKPYIISHFYYKFDYDKD